MKKFTDNAYPVKVGTLLKILVSMFWSMSHCCAVNVQAGVTQLNLWQSTLRGGSSSVLFQSAGTVMVCVHCLCIKLHSLTLIQYGPAG